MTDFGTNGKPICDFLCVNNNSNYLLSYTASEIWPIIGPIFAVDRGRLKVALRYIVRQKRDRPIGDVNFNNS